MNLLQIPDVRTGNDIIDGVVVDEEAVGTEGRGCGAKILYGEGALDSYLSQHKLKDLDQVRPSYTPRLVIILVIIFSTDYHHPILYMVSLM